MRPGPDSSMGSGAGVSGLGSLHPCRRRTNDARVSSLKEHGRRRLARINGGAARLRDVARAFEVLVEAQRVRGRRVAARDWLLRERAEIREACVAPPARLVVLDLEEFR